MRLAPMIAVAGAAWLAGVTQLNTALNGPDRASTAGPSGGGLRVGYLPVTCHLTCPVSHYMASEPGGDGLAFRPIRFQGWPELKESLLAGELDAAFILAPMAIALREQGVPIKVVHLGHRDGSAVVVARDGPVRSIADLRGRTIAVPGRFSNQRLVLLRALRSRGLGMGDVRLVELAPPDMPTALQTGAVDAISSGEPFMAQAEMAGYGRVLFQARDVWPNFISCVLATREEVIRDRPDDLRRLVAGIDRSGQWLDEDPEHRRRAADFVGRGYYRQSPDLLWFALSNPPDRVRYTDLRLRRGDFSEIEELGKHAGILAGTARFEDYTDPSFAPPIGAEAGATSGGR